MIKNRVVGDGSGEEGWRQVSGWIDWWVSFWNGWVQKSIYVIGVPVEAHVKDEHNYVLYCRPKTFSIKFRLNSFLYCLCFFPKKKRDKDDCKCFKVKFEVSIVLNVGL